MPSAIGNNDLTVAAAEAAVSPPPPANAPSPRGTTESEETTPPWPVTPLGREETPNPFDSQSRKVTPNQGVVDQRGVPAMPLPAHLGAPVQDADKEGSVTPKAATPGAGTLDADLLGVAPEGASQEAREDGQVNRGMTGGTKRLANGRRGSTSPLFARRRAGTGVRGQLSFSPSSCRSPPPL